METPYPARYLLNGREIHYDWGDIVAELVDPATGEPR
jgi:hypothetical protein